MSGSNKLENIRDQGENIGLQNTRLKKLFKEVEYRMEPISIGKSN